MEKHEKVTISLPRETVTAAKANIQDSGRTLSGFIRVCVERELKKQQEASASEKQRGAPARQTRVFSSIGVCPASTISNRGGIHSNGSSESMVERLRTTTGETT